MRIALTLRRSTTTVTVVGRIDYVIDDFVALAECEIASFQ
jgi:hypothetical protein